MAKPKKLKKPYPPSVSDRTIFYTDLAYMPPELKNEMWASQMLYFMKKNSVVFLDPHKSKEYRALDFLKVDEEKLKQMIDPITPDGAGGKAAYFSSDKKAYPIYVHLINSITAEVQRTSKKIEVNFTDKYAKTRRMRDNYKILYGKLFRDIINEYAPKVGLSKISSSQDPYKWAQSLSENISNPDSESSRQMGGGDVVSKMSDLIKNQIEDNQDLALFNEYIYKGDYEQAVEKGIQYYMFEQNKWDERWFDEFFTDVRHFNKVCGEWYTDLVTGRPVIERFSPEILNLNPKWRKDGDGIMYYFIEYHISFSEFVKTIGYGLSEEKLKQVFEFHKTQGTMHGLNWVPFSDPYSRSTRERDDAMIRVGRAAALTQDCEVYMDAVNSPYPIYERTAWDWYPDKHTPNKYKTNRDDKNYNVWYSWYYIPPSTSTGISPIGADFEWQANFIFHIKKNQDQFRYGEDGRYSQCPLVLYDNSAIPSFTDVMKSITDKIDFEWQQYQNCLINDLDAIILSSELIGGLLAAVDEDNAINTGLQGKEPTGGEGQSALKEQWQMIKQAGKGFLRMTDTQGNPLLDPSKLMLSIKNGYLEKAERHMAQIMLLYNQLVLNLKGAGDSNIKPRVPVAGVEEALKDSNNSTWFIQKEFEFFVKLYAERFVQYILMIGKEKKEYGYEKRYDEFKDVLGLANGLLIEGLEDIPPESIGLTVNYVDNSSKKEFMVQLANTYIQQGKLEDSFLGLIMGCDNWKQAFCFIRLGIKKAKKEEAAKQDLLHQQALELKQKDLEIAQAMQQKKTDGKDQNIITQGKVKQMIDAALSEEKAKNQAAIKEQMKNNRIDQDNNKSNLNRKEEVSDALSPNQ